MPTLHCQAADRCTENYEQQFQRQLSSSFPPEIPSARIRAISSYWPLSARPPIVFCWRVADRQPPSVSIPHLCSRNDKEGLNKESIAKVGHRVSTTSCTDPGRLP